MTAVRPCPTSCSRSAIHAAGTTLLFLDSSALVKRYVSEEGSAEVSAAIDADPNVVAAVITLTEVLAALTAAHRLGRLARASQHGAVQSAFRRDWTDVLVVNVDVALCESAGSLAERHALRAYDAVQLAAALDVARELSMIELRFGTFDAALRRAATQAGLTLIF